MYKCERCDGKGRIREYGHIDGGRCWRCNGTGEQPRKPSKPKARVWTEKQKVHYAECRRKEALAIELYKDDPRAGVPYGDKYFGANASELAKFDRVWDAL